MTEIHPASIAAIMFALHLFADYTLQGCLANLKQRSWWSKQIPAGMNEAERLAMWRKYRYDYACGLLCHGLYWSLVVCIPLLALGGAAYAVNSVVHGLVHAAIDDAKANRMKLNLWQDQMLHVAQIALIWAYYVFVGK